MIQRKFECLCCILLCSSAIIKYKCQSRQTEFPDELEERESSMPFFDAVNDHFFNPFSCRNRELYFSCITELIERSKEIPVLYEADAKNCLILYLQNCQYAIETEQIGEENEVIADSRTPQENAAAIVRYFRRCGWITPKEVGRSGDNIASVSAYCRKLIDALHKIFNTDSNNAITNHIFSMYEILKFSFEKDTGRAIRPYSSILVPLVEHECDLKNELLILKESIRIIMRAVLKMADVNSFGHFMMKDELLNRFFQDYFFIKKSGLIPSYIANIDRLLQKLRKSEIYARMIEEYTALKRVDEIQAREVIDRQFGELDSFINLEYDRDIGYIDKKINTYYNLYSMRMSMVLGNGTNLEETLNRLLLLLKEAGKEEREELLREISGTHRLMEFGYIGRKSIERRRRRKPKETAGIIEAELSEEEKERLTKELLNERPDRYSMENVQEYYEKRSVPEKGISIEGCGIHSREDAMMAAAAIIYSGTAGFSYEVEFESGMVETETAAISRFRIKRVKNT